MFEQLVDIICNYVEIEQEDIKPESRFMEDLTRSRAISFIVIGIFSFIVFSYAAKLENYP